MAVYKDREAKRPKFVGSHRKEASHSVHETELAMNLHTGTHVDFPRHVMQEDQFECRRSRDVPRDGGRPRPHRRHDIDRQGGSRGPTHRSRRPGASGADSLREDFDFQFVYLAKEAADLLVARGVRGVGIDALGIEPGPAQASDASRAARPQRLHHRRTPSQGRSGLKRYRFVGLPSRSPASRPRRCAPS
ncbi:MAG: hypothetical protein MZU97_06530 [Bacillus subtilis]|nr:hypothetical protein [Bacillus subtilis]